MDAMTLPCGFASVVNPAFWRLCSQTLAGAILVGPSIAAILSGALLSLFVTAYSFLFRTSWSNSTGLSLHLGPRIRIASLISQLIPATTMVRWGELFSSNEGHDRRHRVHDETSARTRAFGLRPRVENTQLTCASAADRPPRTPYAAPAH